MLDWVEQKKKCIDVHGMDFAKDNIQLEIES